MSSKSTDTADVYNLLADIAPAWVHWVAQDASGEWWGYSVEPLRHERGWYENEAGRYMFLHSSEPGNWPASLKRLR